MSLKEKYAAALKLGEELNVKGGDVKEEGGKLIIKGTAEYGFDRDQIWDAIKKQSGWERRSSRTSRSRRPTPYGYWVVKSGETLSKIAKNIYSDANVYMKIFDANKDQLKDPNMIKVGQKLVLPNV